MNIEPHILVIDDERQIVRALRTILTYKHFRVSTAGSGDQGLALAAANPPDVVILDLGLPDMDGLEVCERLREWTQVPIIVLSVRDTEVEKVAALDRGADDYLTKPFGIDELLARVRVALRHQASAQGSPKPVITVGELELDLARHRVSRANLEIKLTATEFKLLTYLATHAGRVLTHQALLTRVWGAAEIDHTEYLRVHMSNLRKKIEVDPDHPQIILTEPGVGYRFIAAA